MSFDLFIGYLCICFFWFVKSCIVILYLTPYDLTMQTISDYLTDPRACQLRVLINPFWGDLC